MLNKWHVLLATVIFAVIGYFTSSTTIEIISAVSGLLCVWLAAKENIWNYPIGFVNIGAFMYIFYDAKLYADFTLQIIFFVLGVYGWAYWLKNKGDKPVRKTSSITKREVLIYSIAMVAGTVIWAYVLAKYTDASIPYADAFIAVLSVIAQILLSKKVLQNWYVWIVVDVLSIGMYFYKGLNVIAVLYIVFLINAIYGAIVWKKNYKQTV